jgi:RimJ/RimL family protein N-acetyltransferase
VSMGLNYQFPDEVKTRNPLVSITQENIDLLRELMPDLDIDFPCVAVVKGGRAISACQSVFVSAQRYEAGVDTLESERKKGYATAAVAGWARTVLELGGIPHYSLARGNVASQGVARKLGLVLYGADLRIT